METFRYKFFARFIYRYANIPANIIIFFYLVLSILGISTDWKFVFPLIVNVILLYVLNRFYWRMYRTFPFNIKIDNEKMICSDFVVNNRSVTINHSEILEISGGIFSGRAFMPLYISTKNTKIGISPHVKDFNKLLTIVLTNIPKDLYEALLNKIKMIAKDNTPTRAKKVSE